MANRNLGFTNMSFSAPEVIGCKHHVARVRETTNMYYIVRLESYGNKLLVHYTTTDQENEVTPINKVVHHQGV